jgi:tetratricopeptide (TPR) repeat protein
MPGGIEPEGLYRPETVSLLAQCQRPIGDRGKALATCQAGRVVYPDDAELLFVEATLLREAGDLSAAEQMWVRLIEDREKAHFGSVDTGLRGHKARNNLACLHRDQRRFAEAEAQWAAAIAEEPGFLPSHSRGNECTTLTHVCAETLTGKNLMA